MKFLKSKSAIISIVILLLALIGFIFSRPIYAFIQGRIFIAKYSDQKDFDLVYPTIQENLKFIRENPLNDSAYYSLGQGYFGLKAFEEAIEALKKAAEISPEKYYHWSFLGKAYQAKKDYPSARDAYIKALEAEPNRPENYVTLAWLYYFRLDPEMNKAFDVLKQGLEKFPNDKNILFDITRYYLYIQNETEFRKYAVRYLKIDPDQPAIKYAYEHGVKENVNVDDSEPK